MIYENGKTCYGRYKDGTCNDYSADKLAEYETVTKIEVLVISDAEECSLESLNQWSDCSGEDGRDINCGPGRFTRFFTPLSLNAWNQNFNSHAIGDPHSGLEIA